MPPLPEPHAAWALYLDFDGTLAELADHPDRVRVAPWLLPLLERLSAGLDGALALVSGRRIDSLDRLLHPARHPIAGLHGMERRADACGPAVRVPIEGSPLGDIRRALAAMASAHAGLLLEDKGEALALHYRNAPGLEAMCRERVEALAGELTQHHVITGKMVLEIKPHAANKGAAIGAFAHAAPFAGRVPVFAGDDRTDEDGFAWVNDNAGISIKVGDGPSCARHRVADVTALHDWLHAVADTLAARPAPA